MRYSHRLALGIEYDGSSFHGWQRQIELPTVQAAVESALSKIAGHPVKVVCAGRTDAGVHATAQVVHFESTANRPLSAWIWGTNTHLPRTIKIQWARQVSPDFDARRSATSRTYHYLIYNHPIRPALLQSQVSWYYRPLDVQRMQAAAKSWLGEHDFSSFRAAECQSHSPIRCVTDIRIQRQGVMVRLSITANAFLHHMVRNMVGVLLDIGAGRAEPHWAASVLQARTRVSAGITAPPNGLYLVSVGYPDKFALQDSLSEASSLGPWFLVDFDRGQNELAFKNNTI